MSENTSLFDKKAARIGVSRSLSICWLFLQLAKLSGGNQPPCNPLLFVPLAFAGLFASVISLRYLINKHSARVEAAIRAAGAALGVSLAFFKPGPVFAFAAAFALMVFFFFQFVRGLAGQGAGKGSFVVTASVFVLFTAIYVSLAPSPDSATAHVALSVLLPAASWILCGTAREPEEAVESPITTPEGAKASKREIWLGLAVSLAGTLASALRSAFIMSANPTYMAEAGIAGSAVFILMLFFMLWLNRRGRTWQALYTVLASFAVGALLSFALGSFGNLFMTFLALILLFMSGAGMLALFFDFCRGCVSPVNLPVACGTAYTVIYSLMGLYPGWGSSRSMENIELMEGVSLPDGLFIGSAIVFTAAVFLISPAILRGHSMPAASSLAKNAAQGQSPLIPAQLGESRDVPDIVEMTRQLTNSERKVFELILVGLSNQQIADELFISINTVKFHIKNVLAKTGVQRKRELLALYVQSRHPLPERREDAE